MNTSTLQAAALGGLLTGVLSAAPVVAIGNVCCCLWIVCGGLLASWVLQRRQVHPITPRDGLLVGLLAGIIGAFVYLIVAVPFAAVTGPMMEQWLERLTAGAGDARLRETLEEYRGSPARVIGIVLGFLFQLCFGVIFSSLGGLLGAMLFKKEQLPPPLPPMPSATDLPPPL